MVHKNLNRPETSLTPFDLLNKNRVYYNIKRQGTTSMVIPCLCLFIVPSGASVGTCRGKAPPFCCARPFCRLKSPLGRSLLRKRGLVGACLTQTLLGTSTANWKLYMPLQIYHIY